MILSWEEFLEGGRLLTVHGAMLENPEDFLLSVEGLEEVLSEDNHYYPMPTKKLS